MRRRSPDIVIRDCKDKICLLIGYGSPWRLKKKNEKKSKNKDIDIPIVVGSLIGNDSNRLKERIPVSLYFKYKRL